MLQRTRALLISLAALGCGSQVAREAPPHSAHSEPSAPPEGPGSTQAQTANTSEPGAVHEQAQAPEPPSRAVVRLERPPFARETRVPAPLPAPTRDLRLRRCSETPNDITDVDAWLARHGLAAVAQPLTEASRRQLAERGVPLDVEGAPASAMLHHADHDVVLYDTADQRGRYLVVVRGDEIVGPFDFALYRDPPRSKDGFTAMDTRWAEARGDVLLVSHAHPTYAASSYGDNAYVTALSLRDGSLLYRSEPLVANALDCVATDAHLVCGYGFTAEKDFLVVLRERDGEVERRLPVKSGPEHILLRDGLLYVRTYDTDYVLATGSTACP